MTADAYLDSSIQILQSDIQTRRAYIDRAVEHSIIYREIARLVVARSKEVIARYQEKKLTS